MQKTSSKELLAETLLNTAYYLLESSEDGPIDEDLDFEYLIGLFFGSWIYSSSFPEEHEEISLERAKGSYFFLYLKNLGVTNAQLLELRTLLRSSTSSIFANEDDINLRIMTGDEFEDHIANCWLSYISSVSDKDEKILPEVKAKGIKPLVEDFCDLFGHSIYNVIVMDDLFTSSIVHLPLNLTLDLQRVVSLSGYIHSAGIRIYARSTDRLSKKDFKLEITNTLNQLPKDQMVALVPYAEELFGEYDKKDTFSGRNGLYDTQFALTKYFMGKQDINSVLQEIKSEESLKDIVFLPTADDINTILDGKTPPTLQTKLCRDYCFFLLVDKKAIFDEERQSVFPGETSYFVTYLQLIKNSNPLLDIKERKIGWEAPVTIPHTLSTALINIATAEKKTNGDPLLLFDPFCGTGTTLIDSMLHGRNIVAVGNDISIMSPFLLRDNIEILAENSKTLRDYSNQFSIISNHFASSEDEEQDFNSYSETNIADIVQWLKDAYPRPEGPLSILPLCNFIKKSLFVDLKQIFQLIISYGDSLFKANLQATIDRINDRGISQEVYDVITQPEFPLSVRISFYAARRGILSSLPLHIFDSNPISSCISKELKIVSAEMRNIAEIQDRSDGTSKLIFSREVGGDNSQFRDISSKIMVSDQKELLESIRDKGLTESRVLISTGDSVSLLEDCDREFDIILTDPPYGFNVPHADRDLVTLFRGLARIMIRALKPNGHLLLALPEFSKNGKEVPYFQTKKFIIHQILSIGFEEGRVVYKDITTMPETKFPYSVPVYWKSTRGVSRSVLHFQIK